MTVTISHPYFQRISYFEGVHHVLLSSEFPIRSFSLRAASQIWPDVHEVESNLGLVEGDAVSWLKGGGYTHEEAVLEALTKFVNWVVHPKDVAASSFVFRDWLPPLNLA